MNVPNGKLAYIVGESFAELSQLPRVLTTTQFVKTVLEESLSLDAVWMIGQGMNETEKNLIEFCKKYCSEINFYKHQTYNEKPSSEKLLPGKMASETILSKLSRLMTNLFHAGKNSMSRWGLSR